MKILGSSWRTSLVGLLMLVGTIIHFGIAVLDGDPATTPNVVELGTALGGLGLMFTRDNKVTSENAGAK